MKALIEKLSAAGVTTVEALADMTPEQLEAIEGIGPKTVEKISLAVNNYFSSLEGGEAGAVAAEGEAAAEPAGEEAAATTDDSTAELEAVQKPLLKRRKPRPRPTPQSKKIPVIRAGRE